jgi:hypothetical protein
VLIAYFVAKSIFGDVYSGTAKVKTIEKISETVVEPSKEIFNSSAINPSVKVQIKNTGNQ